MEPIHAEHLRLAAELEAVRGQVDRRLNHREAGRHLPQLFGGSRLDYGDFAFRMEGCAAVLSRDGQGGALLRERGKLEKFEETRGDVATQARRILSVSPGDGLQAWFAVTHWFKPRSVVEQAASVARLMSPKRTKNVRAPGGSHAMGTGTC